MTTSVGNEEQRNSRASTANAGNGKGKAHETSGADAESQRADEPTADEETIFFETGHIPDRDQQYGRSHKTFPPPRSAYYSDEGDGYEATSHISEDLDSDMDTFDAIEKIQNHFEPPHRDLNSAEAPTPAFPHEEPDQISEMDDDELHAAAEALGIPAQDGKSRLQLIEAIHATLG